MSYGYAIVKRAIDVVVAGGVLVATAPVQLAIGLMVRRQLGSPVLFRQQRPGLRGRPFHLVKFRTMQNPDAARGLVSDADRMTTLGRFLRSTSLDELPTLWNVVRGEMSLVGPRPLLTQYLEHYSVEQARRHEVRPGITGLAQVQGRNATTWEQRFKYDVAYVDSISFSRDMSILGATFRTVLKREGVTAEGHATMPRFDELGECK